MFRNLWILFGIAALGAIGFLAIPAQAESTSTSSGKPKKEAKDPPGTTPIMNQLRSLFAQWDLNSDKYLDKEELAKAFGFSKPYDYVPPPKDTGSQDTDKDKPADDSTAPDNKGALPSTSAYINRPDYQFLMKLDQDGDGQISRDEFMTWARTYAVSLKKVLDYQAKVQKAEEKLAKAVTASERKIAEGDLRKYEQEMNKLNKEVKSYESHLRKTLAQSNKSGHK